MMTKQNKSKTREDVRLGLHRRELIVAVQLAILLHLLRGEPGHVKLHNATSLNQTTKAKASVKGKS